MVQQQVYVISIHAATQYTMINYKIGHKRFDQIKETSLNKFPFQTISYWHVGPYTTRLSLSIWKLLQMFMIYNHSSPHIILAMNHYPTINYSNIKDDESHISAYRICNTKRKKLFYFISFGGTLFKKLQTLSFSCPYILQAPTQAPTQAPSTNKLTHRIQRWHRRRHRRQHPQP